MGGQAKRLVADGDVEVEEGFMKRMELVNLSQMAWKVMMGYSYRFMIVM